MDGAVPWMKAGKEQPGGQRMKSTDFHKPQASSSSFLLCTRQTLTIKSNPCLCPQGLPKHYLLGGIEIGFPQNYTCHLKKTKAKQNNLHNHIMKVIATVRKLLSFLGYFRPHRDTHMQTHTHTHNLPASLDAFGWKLESGIWLLAEAWLAVWARKVIFEFGGRREF